jgi:hypothetical protein
MGKQAGKANKRGRPALPENERRRSNLTLRIRDEARQTLGARAASNGRSLSEEFETLIEHALLGNRVLGEALDLAFGSQGAVLALLLGGVAHSIGTNSGARPWITHPYAFSQVAKGIEKVLEALRPPGAVTLPQVTGKFAGLSLVGTPERAAVLGESMAHSALLTVAEESALRDQGDWTKLVRQRLPQVVKDQIIAKSE